jgi:hypothetical protein
MATASDCDSGLQIGEEAELPQQLISSANDALSNRYGLLGFALGGHVGRQARIFKLVLSPPEIGEGPESVAELSPDRALDRIVAARSRTANALLRQKRVASEPRRVVCEDERTVRVRPDEACRSSHSPPRLRQQRTTIRSCTSHILQFSAAH